MRSCRHHSLRHEVSVNGEQHKAALKVALEVRERTAEVGRRKWRDMADESGDNFHARDAG
jgi:hypothetical protein